MVSSRCKSAATLLVVALFCFCALIQAGTALSENKDNPTAPSSNNQVIPPDPSLSSEGKPFQSSVAPVSSESVEVSTEYAPDRLIVRYNTENIRAESAMMSIESATNAQAGTKVVHDFQSMGVPGMQVVQVTGSNTLEEAMKTYKESADVLYVEPDYRIGLSPVEKVGKTEEISEFSVTSATYPNDPGFQYLWGMYNTGQAPFYGTTDADIDATDAWGITTGSPSVIVAVVDTGVDYTHPDLAANIWQNPKEKVNGIDDDGNGYIDDIRGWNFNSKNNDPKDDNGHGTHCAGTIAAIGNNGIGVTGVAWNVKIMPLKFLNSAGSGYVSDAISAILYANKMGASVISNSWSGSGYTQSLKDAIDASSAVVVCAAGNSGVNADISPQYPAAFSSSNIISVAASDYNDKLASFSNYGTNSVDIAAPGVSIYSTTASNSYRYLSGTSMATPAVSGVAALIKSKNPTYGSSLIKSKILSNVDTISSLSGKVATNGRLNAAKALGTSTPTVTPTVIPTKTPTISPTKTPTPTPTPTLTPRPSGSLTSAFYGSPTYGKVPLRVQFIDQSIGSPQRWTWSFGDGGFSYQKNPYHTYMKKGTYSVRLTVNRGSLSSSLYKQRLITVI